MAFNPLISPVDYIMLGAHDPRQNVRVTGSRSPGLAEVKKASTPRKWDKRLGYGLSGSFPIFRGRDLAEFDVIIRLTEDEDWIDWNSWKPLVEVPPFGRFPKALDIWHPWTEAAKIGSCVVVNVSQPEPDEYGTFTVTIPMLEWRRPKLDLAKPDGAANQTPNESPLEKKVRQRADEIQKYYDQLAGK